MLQASAISEALIAARQYQTVRYQNELKRFGFGESQRRVPALLLPVWNAYGEIVSYQARPDYPRVSKKGKAIKYENPTGTPMMIDVPPLESNRTALRDPTSPY